MSAPNVDSIACLIAAAIVGSEPERENGVPKPDWRCVIATLNYAAITVMQAFGMPERSIANLIEIGMTDLNPTAVGRMMSQASVLAAAKLQELAPEAVPSQPTQGRN
jgi:hypothetical protein